MLQPYRIQNWLTHMRIPWAMPRSEVTNIYKPKLNASGQWLEVYMPLNPPPLRGLISSFHFNDGDQYSPFCPQLEFWAYVWVDNNSEENYRLAYDQVISALGFAPDHDLSLPRMPTWKEGAGSVKLFKHEPSLSDASNKYVQLEPRLSTACSIMINSGWRKPLSSQEREWLRTFTHMGHCRYSKEIPRIVYGGGQNLEYLREHPEDITQLVGRYGISQDGEAIISFDGDFYVLPASGIVRVEVDRMRSMGRNKYGGESKVYVVCNTGYEALPHKRIRIIDCYQGMNTLDYIGSRLGDRINRPIQFNDDIWTD